MPVTTVSVPDLSPPVCSVSGSGWLTLSPPDVAAFHARSASGVKFIEKTWSSLTWKSLCRCRYIINVASLTKCCCTSHIQSIATNSSRAERSALPQHVYSHCLGVWKRLGKGSKSLGSLGATAQTSCLPSSGREGHPGSSASHRWWQLRRKREPK